MAWRNLVRSRPLAVAVLFEAGLVPLAAVLALALGVDPWTGIEPTLALLPGTVAATLPLLLILALLTRGAPGLLRELERLVRPIIEHLFAGRGVGAIVVVSALAGLGEELLFRGVLQVWLGGWLGPAPAIVLAALVFGVVHYLSLSYFLFATGMGLYLGALYHATGDLLLVAAVHALYDGVALAYVLYVRGWGRPGGAVGDDAGEAVPGRDRAE